MHKRLWVPGGYESFTGPSLNDTVQLYKKTTNTWTNDTANPIPPIPGLVPGLADAGSCFDPVGKKVHILDGCRLRLGRKRVHHGRTSGL